MNVAKELNRKLTEAEKTLTEAEQAVSTAKENIKTFIAETKDYSVVLGMEGCYQGYYQQDFCRDQKGVRLDEVGLEAKNVFVFSDKELIDDQETYKQFFENRVGVKSTPFSPDAKFSHVVLFLGFCEECHEDEYEKGLVAAKMLCRDDLIVWFPSCAVRNSNNLISVTNLCNKEEDK